MPSLRLSTPASGRARRSGSGSRQLEDLKTSEREMYELEHAKDQVMTVLKLALANLVMWARDRYFPATYSQASLSPARTVLSVARPSGLGNRRRGGGAAPVQ
jgi:hypothetical protein